MRLWLRERLLWWRCFLPVVFAHKPLCSAFHHHHIHIGRHHVCRSCLLLWSTALLGSLTFYINADLLISYAPFYVGLAATTIALSYPDIYKTYPRGLRDGLRILLGLSGAAMLWLFVYGQWRSGLCVAGVLGSAKLIFTALRARHRDDVCQQCPEFQQRGICSGFRLKSQRMRIYERMLERHILTQAPDKG